MDDKNDKSKGDRHLLNNSHENPLKGACPPLISDAEFYGLVAGQYEAGSKSEDAAAKAKIWQNLQKQMGGGVKAPKSQVPAALRRPFWYAAYGIVAGVVITLLVLPKLRPTDQFEDGLKGESGALSVEVTLTPQYFVDGSWKNFSADEQNNPAASEVIFQLYTPQDAYAALLIVAQNGVAEVAISSQRFAAGEQAEFRIDATTSYRFKRLPDSSTRFCAVAFAKPSELKAAIEEIQNQKQFSVAGDCVSL